jgi:hypothetical protein
MARPQYTATDSGGQMAWLRDLFAVIDFATTRHHSTALPG